MPGLDIEEVAHELMTAKVQGGLAERPSARDEAFDIAAAYSVGAALTRQLEGQGHKVAGRKIGFSNPALWSRLGLDSVIWAHVYDNTVFYAKDNKATFSLKGLVAPKIEPEVVFKLREPLTKGSQDAAEVLAAIEWIALGFEIVDCNYANWRFKPADMVADFGFHAALIIGEPQPLPALDSLVKQLQDFKLSLYKNAEVAAEGGGSVVLGSPALSLGSVADIVSRQSAGGQIAAGEVITTGTLTDAMFITAGEKWRATPDGLALPELTITFE